MPDAACIIVWPQRAIQCIRRLQFGFNFAAIELLLNLDDSIWAYFSIPYFDSFDIGYPIQFLMPKLAWSPLTGICVTDNS